MQAWLDAYVAAWRSYEPAAIGALFTADATYAYHPYDSGEDVLRGRDAIVANWLEDVDDPGTWEASYRPLMVDGDRAVAVGVTSYTDRDEVFDNLFQLTFRGEECAEFVEWYMNRPADKLP